MNIVSASIGFLAGGGVLAMAGKVYADNCDKLFSEQPITMQLFGNEFVTDPRNVLIGLVVAAGIGLLIILLAIVRLFKRKPVPDTDAERNSRTPTGRP
jgi:hypothetical protein